MALAVAADHTGQPAPAIEHFEILQPLALPPNGARETLCRVSPSTGVIEILSRPRLVAAPFTLHARARIIEKPGPAPQLAPRAAPGEAVPGREIYARAERVGLDFGPAFRQAASATRLGPRTIRVNLKPQPAHAAGARYGLDPARLDSCFHGLILLFDDLAKETGGRPAAYLPVRVGEIRLERPGAPIAEARIDVRRRDARAIVADFALFDADGALVATLREARYQAVRTPFAGDLSTHALAWVRSLADAPAAPRGRNPLTPQAFLDAARPETETLGEPPEALVLIEGFAAASAFRFAAALTPDASLAPDALVAAGRLAPERAAWFADLVRGLVESGLAIEADAGARLDRALADDLPEPDAVLRSLAADHPDRAAELLLAARAGAGLDALARGESFDGFSAAAVDGFELGSVGAAAAADGVAVLLRRLAERFPPGRALRILALGCGPLLQRLEEAAPAGAARLFLHDPDPIRLQRAKLAAPPQSSVLFLDSLAGAPSFDLILAADALGRLAPDAAALGRLLDALAPGGALAAVEPAPSLFRDLVFGLDAARPRAGRVPGQADWRRRLEAARFAEADCRQIATAAGPALLLVAARSGGAERAPAAPPAAALIQGGQALRGPLTAALEAEGCGFAAGAAAPDVIVELPDPQAEGADPVATLAARCLALKASAERLGQRGRLFVVTRAGLAGDRASPVEAGVASFSRVLANEVPALVVRRVDLAAGLAPQEAAQRLAALVCGETPETDLLLEPGATRALRLALEDEDPAASPPAPACRLEKGEGGALDRIRWTPAQRRAPGPDEIEIEVEASGLNFRDVMWGLSVLPDEILEDGFAGPTLGLECAGRVVRVGEGVAGFAPGDAVVAFAGGAFASHVTIRADVAAQIPPGLGAEAAASIPVAFLTAWHALIECARLEEGETVLIHGGAGGVGLAALQIARWRGATPIATAGSPEKRDLLRALGAAHAFDGRSGGFVDEVRKAAPNGVSVVLNSLSGEAMERSIGLLEPFGRFIELGKRDYVANTQIGLRPFRRNLSYHGVDLDQLILAQPARARRLFREVMALFAQGALWPVPYRAFRARDSVEAMRLMQQSGHVGKIVIAPPKPGETRLAPHARFAANPDKTHLVTGGFGGFGLQTARWLVEHGARHLALVGRSGAQTPAARQALAELRAAGARVHAAAVDMRDEAAVAELLATLAAEAPPLGGVMHAAAELDDGLIAHLDGAKLAGALGAKAAGAELLDRLTRDAPLDYFVLFSSATTAIGNPGQGAYVAANGYLEGLARRRRAEGLPALAVAWGAIEDVGMLARNRAVREALATRAGVRAMPARRALELLGEALARPAAQADGVLVVADMNWRLARQNLPLLGAPAYARLTSGEAAAESVERVRIDLAGLVAAKDPDEVRKIVGDVIVEEIARILRLPADAMSRTRPLAEIGLDSLMAVELGASLEERLSLDAPLSASAGGLNVRELAEHIVAASAGAADEGEAAALSLAEKHLGRPVDAPLTALVEERSRNLTQILR